MENMINNRQLPLLAFIILLTCDQDVMALNLTFYHDNVSWRKAADFCSKHNGFMESNASLVMKTIVDNNIEDVWFGKYEVYSQWAYIRGCFLINGHLTNFTVKHADEFQCQSLCDNYTFYTVQDTQCFCTDDISTFERQADCNCSDCYKVREHQLTTYTYELSDKDNECITATCNGNQLKRAYRSCEKNFFVTCDDNRNLRYSYNNQTTASKECARNGSFIKWYLDDFCNSSSPTYPFWTSGRRLKHIFHLNKSDEIHDGVLHRCFKLQRDEDRMIEEDDEDCNEMFPFVCNFGWTEDDDDISINSTNNISPGEKVHSDKTAGIVAGVIVSIFAAIAVILVLIFIHRRRLTKMKPNNRESQNSSRVQDTIGMQSNQQTFQAPVNKAIVGDQISRNNLKLKYLQTVNNITYNQVNSSIIPKPQNLYHSVNMNSKACKKDYGMAKVQNGIGDSSEGGNASNYCLAKPITSTIEEETDPYDINKDYDHLHNVTKREDPIIKVYDHLPTTVNDDPTYDHSNFQSVAESEGYYDHFKTNVVDN